MKGTFRWFAVGAVGSALAVVIARRFLPRQKRVVTLMRVTLVDEDGNVVRNLGTHVVKSPKRYPKNGLAHLEREIERLLASRARRTSLSFHTPDDYRGASLRNWDGSLSIHFFFHPERADDKESEARAFFAARNLAPTTDYVASNGRIPDSPTILGWPLERSAARETTLAVLREVFKVRDEEPLDIRFEIDR